ncbi:UNVERIFIED_CONTAM: hypothetical protein O8I53_07705 [Campylobacter lari]
MNKKFFLKLTSAIAFSASPIVLNSCYSNTSKKAFETYQSTIFSVLKNNQNLNEKINSEFGNINTKNNQNNLFLHKQLRNDIFINNAILKNNELNSALYQYRNLNKIVDELAKLNNQNLNLKNLEHLKTKIDIKSMPYSESKYLNESIKEYLFLFIPNSNYLSYSQTLENDLNQKIDLLIQYYELVNNEFKNNLIPTSLYENSLEKFKLLETKHSLNVLTNNYNQQVNEIIKYNDYLQQRRKKGYADDEQEKLNGYRLKLYNFMIEKHIMNLNQKSTDFNASKIDVNVSFNFLKDKLVKLYSYELINYQWLYNSFAKMLHFIYGIGPTSYDGTYFLTDLLEK